MNNDVRQYLNSCPNPLETYESFIRNAEREFGLEEKALFFMTLEDVKEYVDFLEDLWSK